MGIPLDEVWEMPVLKKLAYGEHLAAREKFEAYVQRVMEAQQREDYDVEDMIDGMDVGGGGQMPNMGNMGGQMPNMSQMGNVGGMGNMGASGGGSNTHPALRKYQNSKTGRVVNVVGDDDDGESDNDE